MEGYYKGFTAAISKDIFEYQVEIFLKIKWLIKKLFSNIL